MLTIRPLQSCSSMSSLGMDLARTPSTICFESAKANANAGGRTLAFVGHVCGTDLDPQGRSKVLADLKSAGVLLASSNAEAATWSSAIIAERKRVES